VPAGSNLSAIAAHLFPSEEFRGPMMVDRDTLPMEAAGYQCYFRGGSPRIVRVWVFAIEDDQWLAVPIHFRDTKGCVRTSCDRDSASFGWSVTKSLHKRRFETKSAEITATDGTFPADGEIIIGPIEIR
jgi:hypothetical protein